MLLRNPRFIAERCPRLVPRPSVLVPAIEHVFNTFGPSLDAKTNAPLFSKQAWTKANAVVELAREGYLSDIEGVAMYEKAGVDKYGLEKFKSLRGTNNVEGGPHGDIYRKFGALNGMLLTQLSSFVYLIYIGLRTLNLSSKFNISKIFSDTSAGPRFTVNCLTDHRTWYNLQVGFLYLFENVFLNLIVPLNHIGLRHASLWC